MLQGKKAVITGGSRGIGKGIVLKFAELGADVVFSYRSSEQEAKEVEEKAKAFGVQVLGVKSDASQMKDAESLEKAATEFFGEAVDILINNAGITRDNLLMRMSEEDFDAVMNVNMKSIFNCCKSFQRGMLKKRKGSIINITSVVGVKGNAGQSNYAASKAGAIGFTKSIAQELGSRNIRCNAVAPGFIETEMTGKLPEDIVENWLKTIPLRRAGSVDDVAHVCAFLGSDYSAYVTGQVINTCGGMLT